MLLHVLAWTLELQYLVGFRLLSLPLYIILLFITVYCIAALHLILTLSYWVEGKVACWIAVIADLLAM